MDEEEEDKSVTVATPGIRQQTLTLAVPIQPPSREDCWSEGATSALIDAWGEHFLDLSRGNVKQKHWQQIAEIVSSRDDYTKPPRSDIQCKNRIDTLKKKYKIEKSKLSSSWLFFRRLDFLLKTPICAAGFLSRFPQKQRTGLPARRKNSFHIVPPPPANGRRRGVVVAGMRELTNAVLKFGEVYRRVESAKLQHAVEMEKQRMGFCRELEMQRMEFFLKTQMELSRCRRHESSGSGENNGM